MKRVYKVQSQVNLRAETEVLVNVRITNALTPKRGLELHVFKPQMNLTQFMTP